MTHVRIHYSTNDGEHRFEAVTDQPRTVVFDGDYPYAGTDDLELAEILWSAFNRHDADDQHPSLDADGLRSMSVGDVLEIVEPGNGRWFICASFGWERIEGIRA